MRAGFLTGALLTVLAATASAGVFPFKYEVHVLDNGLKVVLVPLPSQGLMSYFSVVRTGSRDEVEPGHTGFAHFFEHMMFRGTEKYPGPVFDKIVTSLGASSNAYTTDDYTCYYMSFASADLPRVVEIEADRFQNLSYAEREFQTEAGAVYGEYRKGRTEPAEVLAEALQDKAFDVHTYKHTTIGFEKDVAAMPTMFDYSKSFFARYYRPDNVVILVTGDFEPARVLALIREHYAAWKPGYKPPAVQPEPEQKGERSVDVSYQGRTLPILTLAWKGAAFDPGSREMAAAALLGNLAFGETSDVYRELVLEKRLVQRLMVDFGPSRDPGLWTATALVAQPQDLDAVKQALDATVARFQQSAPDARQLEDAKRRARYQFLMGMDTPYRVAQALARYVALTGGIEAVDQLYATIAQVTPQDVQAAARKFLAPERRTVAVLKGVAS
jgi:zinc protease